MVISKERLIEIRRQAVHVYIMFLLGVFPFLMHDGFLDISKTKSDILIWTTCILTGICILTTLLLKEWKVLFKKSNYLIYLAIIVIGVTTLKAWYTPAAMSGEYGRYQGALVYWSYCFSALWIVNFGEFKKQYLDIASISGSLLCIIAVLNFYEIDVLGTLGAIVERQRHSYISTIGNVNIFAAYLSIFVPITIVSAIYEKETKMRLLRYVAVVCGFAGMIASISDSVYITLGVVFIALPFFCLKEYETRKRMAEILFLFGATLVFFCIINWQLWYPVFYVDGIAKHFLELERCSFVVLVAVILYMFFYLSRKKLADVKVRTWKKIWACISTVLGIVVGYVYISNTSFNEEWGTLRGTIWAQGLDFFGKQKLERQMFGIGLDSVQLVFRSFYGDAAMVKDIAYYDNLHNEYLQYLITIGIVGLVVYLIAMAILMRGVLCKSEKNVGALTIAMAGMAYMMQAVVNISMSSVTTIVLLLLFIGQTIEDDVPLIKKSEKKSK